MRSKRGLWAWLWVVLAMGGEALAQTPEPAPPPVVAPTPPPADAPSASARVTAPTPAIDTTTGSWELRAQGLEAFLAGQLSPDKRPAAYLTVDPTDPLWSDLDGGELVRLIEALATAPPMAAPATGKLRRKPGTVAGLALARAEPPRGSGDANRAARDRYIAAIMAYRTLTPIAREALHKTHERARRAHLTEVDARLSKRALVQQLQQKTAAIRRLVDVASGVARRDSADPVVVQDPAELLKVPLADVRLPETDRQGASSDVHQARQDLDEARLDFYKLPAQARAAIVDAYREKSATDPNPADPPVAPTASVAPSTQAPSPTGATTEGDAPAGTGPTSSATAAAVAPTPVEPSAEDSEEERLKAARADDADRAAKEAAAQKALALVAAKQARTEATRQVAEERARLLGVKEAQQTFNAELNRRTSQAKTFAIDVAAWQKTLTELEKSAMLSDDVAAAAENLYLQVAPAMEQASSRLSTSLDALAADTSEVPAVGSPPAEAVPATSRDPDLTTLRSELVGAERELSREEARVRWEVAEVLQSELANLGDIRNALLPLLGASLRDRMTGFGAAGVEQVQREFSELQLLARYRLAAWPRTAEKMLTEAKTSPIPWLVYLLKVVLLVWVLRWWRRHGDELLGRLSNTVNEARRTSLGARIAAPPLWYFKRLHRPLALLLFWAAFIDWTAQAVRLPELGALWLIAKWILIGQLIIGALDALGSRARRAGLDPLQELRFRSLRLVGLTVVVIGLVLALVKRAVGEGAIYGWVLDLSLLLTLPIVWKLVRWWRPEVAKRATMRRQENAIIAWVAANAPDPGVPGWVASAAGGLYLLVETVYRWLFQRLVFFDTTRRALAFLARRSSETQKQNRAGLTAIEPTRIAQRQGLVPEGFDPNDASDMSTLDEAVTPEAFVPSAVDKDVPALAAILDSKESAIVAIVGERGVGKTTHLNRALKRSSVTRTIQIRAQPNGYVSVKTALLIALGLEATADLEAITAKIQEERPQVICIDQSHRIIRPEIGGLDGFDELVQLARSVGGGTCWVMIFNTPVWMHIKRARGHRAIFHSVTLLPPWTEGEVAELCMKRAAAAGLSPSFKDLEIPRLPDDDVDADPAERHRRGYFRMLWEYSAGNPSIALHFWVKSLFSTEADEVVVRMFQAPNIAVLADLPESVYFVMRAVIQREWASAKDVVSSTRLSPEDVADALAWAQRGGLLELRQGRVRVDFEWYRSVATVLRRRHLLVG